MGYDMYVVDADGKTVTDGCHETHYWRRNIFGGGPQAERLVKVGMGYWSAGLDSKPDWPDEKDYGGVKYNDEYDEDDPATYPEWLGERGDEYKAALTMYLKATYDERPGIAVYKLCSSNDGWWVTKAECQSALKLWEEAGRPEVDTVGDTIPFLRAAADHEGFRVW